MSENPLLPNAQLRALHALLTQAAEQKKQLGSRKTRSLQPGSPVQATSAEALLAGTLLQLGSEDIFLSASGDRLAATLARLQREGSPEAPSTFEVSPSAPALSLATALAAGLQQAERQGVCLAILSAGATEERWAKALAVAETEKLPLILAFADPSGPDAFRNTLNGGAADSNSIRWESMQKVTSRLKLPVLSVDGEDAVATYRVMQESLLRARAGGGPAVLWAMLPTAPKPGPGRPKAPQALRRLEHYMRTRAIAP